MGNHAFWCWLDIRCNDIAILHVYLQVLFFAAIEDTLRQNTYFTLRRRMEKRCQSRSISPQISGCYVTLCRFVHHFVGTFWRFGETVWLFSNAISLAAMNFLYLGCFGVGRRLGKTIQAWVEYRQQTFVAVGHCPFSESGSRRIFSQIFCENDDCQR